MRRTVVALFSVLLGCGSTLAADLAEVSPNINEARFGWGGVYAGISGGYARIKDVDYAPLPGLPSPLYDQGEDWIFGAHAGYLFQYGNFVAGGEAEAMKLDITYEGFDFITVDDAFAFKGRAGYAFDRTLVSGHLGAVYARTNYLDLKDWGWDAGIGVDYAITDNITVGGQYSHYQFSEFDGTQIDAKVDLLTARMGLKF